MAEQKTIPPETLTKMVEEMVERAVAAQLQALPELIRRQVAEAVAEQMEVFSEEIGLRKAALLANFENAAHLICDRNISEFSRQFEVQVNQSFRGVAQWLENSRLEAVD